MGTRGKIVDVIHHLSPKVPKFHSGDVEIALKYGQFSYFYQLPNILGTNGDKWGLMETIGD